MRRGQPLILLLDLLILAFCFELAFYFRFEYWHGAIIGVRSFWLMVSLWVSTLYISGSYDFRQIRIRSYFLRVSISAILSLGVVILINYFLQKDRTGIYGRGIITLGFMLSALFAVVVRWIWSNALEVREGQRVFALLVQPSDQSAVQGKIKGLFPNMKMIWFTEVPKTEGDLSKLKASDALILGTPIARWPEADQEKLLALRMQGKTVWELSHYFERELQKLPVHYLTTDWFLSSDGFTLSTNPYFARTKRVFDLLLSTFLLVLTLPVMILVGIMIFLESGRPLFFSQIRVGKLGYNYKIFKFRTMVKDAEKDGAQWAKKNDSRITRLGNFLRKTRLDELPQIYNVFRGEMSFIGPRPERPEFVVDLEKQIPFYSLRHWVNPGITGWAQVNYPYGASIDDAREKLEYDLYYIKNFGFLLDVKILLKTIRVVFLGHGR